MKVTKRTLRNLKKARQNKLEIQTLRPEFRGVKNSITMDMEVDLTDLKGFKGGRCNVKACQRPGAVFLNVGMSRCSDRSDSCWYCVDCASDINMCNTKSDEGFTLFPAFDEVLARYKQLFKEGRDPEDISNYEDINQDPWGSCHHFARDTVLEVINEDLQ